MKCKNCKKKTTRNSHSQKYCKKCAFIIWQQQKEKAYAKHAEKHFQAKGDLRCVICNKKIARIKWAKKICLSSICKYELLRQQQKRFYKKHRAKILKAQKIYQKKYQQTERGKEVSRRSSLKYIRKKIS